MRVAETVRMHLDVQVPRGTGWRSFGRTGIPCSQLRSMGGCRYLIGPGLISVFGGLLLVKATVTKSLDPQGTKAAGGVEILPSNCENAKSLFFPFPPATADCSLARVTYGERE
ncbi:hypothetical protein PCH_Pc18g04470 [Penicillium rubens Wisconsin 54-1255]|uniref:Uncharacterized protein n=1 Tax=Penicillium rubens (strain ATCC 28089 / DSM 1075 / NRRL 1951 / Wisconsin 54-1255) TaxID=500485 RepID=B6HBL4_PENRW|nr:hypothetical protein PCH_Pc18g04470 [Penicillium rubens Wisconsin 54-1255]